MQLFAFPHIVDGNVPAEPASKAKAQAPEEVSRTAKLWGQGGFMTAQARVSTFFRRSPADVSVQPGARYRHCAAKLTETAEVIAIIEDEMGIPHVRFRVTIQTPYQNPVVDGPRTLNLKSFRERYRETVMA